MTYEQIRQDVKIHGMDDLFETSRVSQKFKFKQTYNQ